MSAEAKVHVFTAMFEANEDASAFGHPHWEPEPNGDASDDEYAAWEDRNPIWPLKSELGHRLDSDSLKSYGKAAKSRIGTICGLGYTTRMLPKSRKAGHPRIPLSLWTRRRSVTMRLSFGPPRT